MAFKRAGSLLLLGLIALGGIGAFISASYKNDLARARSLIGGDARTVNTPFGLVEYVTRGDGPALLSIHGAGGGFDQGLALAAGFVDGGYRVIAPSRFGYLGTSVPKDISPAAQADAHAALLDEVNAQKAVVVGVSAGARSALELALRHPAKVSALILVVPGTYAPDSPVSIEASRGSQFAFWLVNAGADFMWWGLEKIAPDVLIRFLGTPPDLVAAAPRAEQERVMELVRSIQPLSRRFAGINIDSTPALHRLPLEEIDVPTLIIASCDDLFNTRPAAEFAAGLIPNAKFVLFENGGHLLVGREREVRRIIADFLSPRAEMP